MKCDLLHKEKKQAKRRCSVTNGIHFNLCLVTKILPFTCLFLIPKNDKHFSETYFLVLKMSKSAVFSLGRGGRNRTLLWSFGDSHSTDELHPYKCYLLILLIFLSFVNLFCKFFTINLLKCKSLICYNKVNLKENK